MSRRSIGSLVFALVVLLSLAPCAILADGYPVGRENNWHQFRGPDSTGVAPKGNPPTTWGEQTNVKWKVGIPGRGLASPIVWGDKIFILTAIKTDRTGTAGETAQTRRRTQARLVAEETPAAPAAEAAPPADNPPGDGGRESRRGRGRRGGGGGGGWGGPPEVPTHFHQFVVMCLDRKTGNTLWQEIAADAVPIEAHHGTASYASASPVTDGKNLYVSFGSQGVHSYDLDGNFRWKKPLNQMRTRHSFGEGASPTLYGDTLVVNCDQEEGKSYIVAFDADTGEEKWRKDRDEATTWTTPLIVEHSGRTQVIVNGTNRARSYDINTGEIIWECGGQAQGVVPTPIVYGDLALLMTGHRGSALYAIPLDSQGDITDTDKVVWTRDQGTPYVPSALLYGDSLYFTKSNDAIMTCVSAETGEVKFENKRLEGLSNIYSSLVGAAGRIYVCGRDGTTLVLKNAPELEIIATNHLGEAIDATPAIVDNELFIRGEKHLFCIAEN